MTTLLRAPQQAADRDVTASVMGRPPPIAEYDPEPTDLPGADAALLLMTASKRLPSSLPRRPRAMAVGGPAVCDEDADTWFG